MFLYSSIDNLNIGQVVYINIHSRKKIGIIFNIPTNEYIIKENINLDKIKPIIEIIPYVCDEKYIKYITQIAGYNMQYIGDVIANIGTNFEFLTQKSRLKKEFINKKSLYEFNLSDEQLNIVNQIILKLDRFSVNLIDGVTGGGKTIVYLNIVHLLLKNLKDRDSQILISLPEIALTPQTKEFFENIIGIEPILWHSGITKAIKKISFKQIISGEARIILGTRSSILLPYENLKLIIVDEEHDMSYKQNEGMVYSGKDMAIMRASSYNIPIILASATPTIESYFNSINGKYYLYKITKRHADIKMPHIQIVNMLQKDNKPLSGNCISPVSINIAKEIIAKGEQVLFFLNRRGFASSILCGSCQQFIQCDNCSVNMAYHASKNLMICHYCGKNNPIPNSCKSCNEQDKWVKIGFGVERVAQEIKLHFPNVIQQIFSSDDINKENISEILQDIVSGKTQIIIGTQMISKGYNFPHLKCVIIVDSDTGCLDGDFRIYEKTYQTITQVAGRAGRFGTQGSVIIQSYHPNNPSIQAIAKMDKDGFYSSELKRRNSKFNPLPPYSRQIAIIIAGSDAECALLNSRQISKYLYENISHICKIFGPAPSLIQRINRQYRYRILLNAPKDYKIIDEIRNAIFSFKPSGDVMIKIDVDPINFT